jgi:hypothetical protein
MVNNTINDNYLEYELEKALMNERDRHFIFKLEESVIEFDNYNGGLFVYHR